MKVFVGTKSRPYGKERLFLGLFQHRAIHFNLGIGTTGPSGKLDVNGTIYQRGSLLHADHVFEPDYNLESIEEHAEYMWREKHLKAVPKAKKDGEGQDVVEIGALNRGVLEELEKAHVYIQQLNERVKLLEARLAKQG